MKKILVIILLCSIPLTVVAGNTDTKAEYKTPVLPSIPSAGSGKYYLGGGGKITPIPVTENDRKNTAKPDAGPIEVTPPTSEAGKKLWQQCSEIAEKEGKPYQYLAGKLTSKTLLTERQIGDKTCHYPGQKNCPTVDETKEPASYVTSLLIDGNFLTVSISGTTALLKDMDLSLLIEKPYMLCAYYKQQPGWSGYSTTHLETIKQGQ